MYCFYVYFGHEESPMFFLIMVIAHPEIAVVFSGQEAKNTYLISTVRDCFRLMPLIIISALSTFTGVGGCVDC